MSEAADLIEALERLQRSMSETDAQFARRIGCSRQMWNFLRRRKVMPGRETVQGIIEAFPGLRDAAVAFLLPENARIQATRRPANKQEVAQ